jgi:hypothetical protein
MEHRNCLSSIRFSALAVALAGALAVGGAWAQHAGHDAGGSGASGGAAKGGGKGMGGHSMHGGHGAAAGEVKPMCGGHEGMPPHYCAPHFHVMSSVPGVAIFNAEPMGEKSVMVTLKAYPGVSTPRLVIVGGGGQLAGGTTVAAGWKDGAVIHLDLAGTGSLYAQAGVHLHVFPLTGK